MGSGKNRKINKRPPSFIRHLLEKSFFFFISNLLTSVWFSHVLICCFLRCPGFQTLLRVRSLKLKNMKILKKLLELKPSIIQTRFKHVFSVKLRISMVLGRSLAQATHFNIKKIFFGWYIHKIFALKISIKY